MNPVANAIARARTGLDWSRPCLIWLADYLVDAGYQDIAANWRGIRWGDVRSRRELVLLARRGSGGSPVGCVMDWLAREHGWEAADSARQGAVMVGVFDHLAADGVPAIFDGQDRWIAGLVGGGWSSLRAMPDRAWEVRIAAG